jgi:hypothetical protein
MIVLVSTIAITSWAHWYADNVSIPRYCHAPEETLQRLERILTEARPAGDGATRPYVVPAKLIFLLPRQPEETVPAYLSRLRAHIEERCL